MPFKIWTYHWTFALIHNELKRPQCTEILYIEQKKKKNASAAKLYHTQIAFQKERKGMLYVGEILSLLSNMSFLLYCKVLQFCFDNVSLCLSLSEALLVFIQLLLSTIPHLSFAPCLSFSSFPWVTLSVSLTFTPSVTPPFSQAVRWRHEQPVYVDQ